MIMNKQELINHLEEKFNIASHKAYSAKEDSNYRKYMSGYRGSLKNVIDFIKQEKTIVPKEFDEWYKEIQEIKGGNEAKRFALWKICQFGFGCGFEDVKDRKIIKGSLTNWVMNHKEKAIDAVLNGYQMERPYWLVAHGRGLAFYLANFISDWGEENTPKFRETDDINEAYKFSDIEKAKSAASLIDGIVIEVGERA